MNVQLIAVVALILGLAISVTDNADLYWDEAVPLKEKAWKIGIEAVILAVVMLVVGYFLAINVVKL